MSDYFERVETHLLDAVERNARPRPTWLSRRAAIAAGGIAAIAGAVLLVLALTAGTSQPAYAVVVRPDGSVALTLNELVGLEPANARLAALGVRARLVGKETGCTAKARPVRWLSDQRRAAHGQIPAHSERRLGSLKQERLVAEDLARSKAALHTLQSMIQPQHTANGVRMIIHPGAIPHGLTLVLAFRPVYPTHPTHRDRGQIMGVGGSMSLYHDPPPRCLPNR